MHALFSTRFMFPLKCVPLLFEEEKKFKSEVGLLENLVTHSWNFS